MSGRAAVVEPTAAAPPVNPFITRNLRRLNNRSGRGAVSLSMKNPCPRGHQMRLQHVELPPRQVVHRGGVGGWQRARYSQWVCPTCGHRGIPLPASR